jgi:AcrR family transcriptional regulator
MQQRSRETRFRILTAAQALFARDGYDATGVADICELAGVSKGAFFHHFPTKHAIFMAMLDEWLKGIDTQLEAALKSAGNVAEGLVKISGMVQGVFTEADQRLPLFLEFWTKASRDPEVWENTIAPYRRYQALFTEFMRRGIEEGSIKAIDPEMSARLVLAMALGLVFQGILDREQTDWSQIAQEAMQIMAAGLKNG